MPSREIALSTIWQLASQCTVALLSILTVKFVAMGLSRDLVGAYNSAYGYLQLFGILADFGLYAVVVREMSHVGEVRRVLGVFFRIRLFTVSVAMGGAVLLAWFLPQWRGTPLPIGVTFAAIVPVFTLLAGVFRTIFQVQYRMHNVFIAEVGQRVVTVVLLGWLLFLGVRESAEMVHYDLFILFGGVGAGFLFLFSSISAQKLLPRRDDAPPLSMGPFFRAAFPYGIAYLCIALYRQLDVTLIALLRPDFQLQNANYGFAVRLAEMAYLVPTFLLNAALPRLKGGAADRQLLQRLFFSLLMFGTTAALVAGLWATPIMRLLTSEAYLRTGTAPGADSALALLALPMFLNSLILFCFYVLLSSNTWRPLLRILLIGAILSLAGNLFLIPRYGFMGAGITSMGTHVVLCALLLLNVRGRWNVLSWTLFFRWVLFAGIIALFLVSVRPFFITPFHFITGAFGCSVVVVILLEVLGIRKILLGELCQRNK
ncbi:oligosaccharide flippase family protein [Candidatus Peregrinibacteria bacterium]|nr:oligosaccharide flippase family protein [Candidatus Peregrinibacteria bacterium]MBI2524204.1 oligosaccharide flippase family protein [Candidatus Peregrinibacteria bacterium]MBI4129147.1 oligosaccharide flippase family protein [Candidatus Peregrinibacteria bacterium]